MSQSVDQSPDVLALPSGHAQSTTCPTCHNSDAIQRVSVAIDSGATSTTGTAGTLTTQGALAYTRFISSSVTSLSARIAPPPRPNFPFRRTFLQLWIICTILGAMAVAGQYFSGGTWIVGFGIGLWTVFVTWIPALLVTVISKAVTASSYTAQQAIWDRRAQELRSAYYCARDDVVFDREHVGAPEDFRRMVFSR